MNKNILIIKILILLIINSGCSLKTNNISADIIYTDVNFITMNDEKPFASSMAVKDGIIIAIGDESEVIRNKSSSTSVISLNNQTAIPGFIDAHSHFAGVGLQAIVANLLPVPDGPVNSIKDLQEAMRKYISSSVIVKKYKIAIGFNYDDSQLIEKRHPTRHDLDAISTEIPIVVMHQSGHLGVYNTKALEIMSINNQSPNPSGGMIVRESDGITPNGVMEENAHFMLFYKMIPQFDQNDLVAMYKASEKVYVENGFTTVQEGKTDLGSLELIPKIAKSTGFKIDIISYPDLTLFKDYDKLDEMMTSNYINNFRVGGVKLTFDGSPQGKTAWFTEPYFKVPEGQSENYNGYPAFSDEEAAKLLAVAYKYNWQLMVHTNGDAAIDQLIKIVDQSKDILKDDHRTVMIHGQYTREDQVYSLKELGIFPALYPMHTFYWGDWHRDSVAGPKRAINISPTGWFLNNQVPFTIHSDAPVTFPNSMRILDSAVNRTTRSGKTLGKEHKISVLNALKSMTIWAAYQHFEEDIKGSLEVGKQADFVVLNQNPLKVETKFIKDIEINSTINNGEIIFSQLKKNK